MYPASDRVKLTYEDLVALPDDGMRHELIDGEHYVTPSPATPHQLILGNLYLLIANYVREQRLGVVLFAPFDVVFSRYDVVVPDLIYFSTARFKEVVGDKNAQGPPNLAIEILSPSTRRRDEIHQAAAVRAHRRGRILGRRSRSWKPSRSTGSSKGSIRRPPSCRSRTTRCSRRRSCLT